MDRRNFIKSAAKLLGTATIGSFIQACSSILGGRDTDPSTSSPTITIQSNPTPDRVEHNQSPVAPQPTLVEEPTNIPSGAQVALVVTNDRAKGLLRALQLVALPDFRDQEILIKPNFNSADPAPGSTHPVILEQLIRMLKDGGASRIIVGDRSGMGNTRQVFSTLGIFEMAEELGSEVLIFDELAESEWQYHAPEGTHWSRGFALPKILHSVDRVIQVCCLKTHRFGGHFTMSLKNSIGLVAKTVPGDRHNYMTELHDSVDQRKMIAEVNAAYTPDLVILDGFEAFTDGGPDWGTKIQPGVILAGADRVAIDAIGVAILRKFGTTREVQTGPVFEQEQIARAIELKLGVAAANEISIVSDSDQGAELAAEINQLLA